MEYLGHTPPAGISAQMVLERLRSVSPDNVTILHFTPDGVVYQDSRSNQIATYDALRLRAGMALGEPRFYSPSE